MSLKNIKIAVKTKEATDSFTKHQSCRPSHSYETVPQIIKLRPGHYTLNLLAVI